MADFATFSWNDVVFMLEGALRTLHITAWAVVFGTLLGALLGWLRATAPTALSLLIGAYTDIHRSIPLLVQLILFNSAVAAFGHPMDPFESGVIVLILYTGAYCSEIVRAGILAVPVPTRWAARSLGMTYLQDLRYIVFPLGARAMLPSWIGLVLGVVKDSALVAVLGYVELLRASQIVITRTQEPLLVLLVAGAFYFLICLPISRQSARLEQRLRT